MYAKYNQNRKSCRVEQSVRDFCQMLQRAPPSIDFWYSM